MTRCIICRLLCRMGFHKWGLFAIVDIEVAPEITIARRQCERCPRVYYDDPDRVPKRLISK